MMPISIKARTNDILDPRWLTNAGPVVQEFEGHFAKVVQFRLSMDLEHVRRFSLAIDRQYFEDFLPLAAYEVFVDGGGYDGQTTLKFAAWNNSYRRIYYFEPGDLP